MRILDDDNDASVRQITLYLTKPEATELRDSLEALLADPNMRHEHISDFDSAKEITVCIYDKELMKGLNERSRRLILEDR